MLKNFGRERSSSEETDKFKRVVSTFLAKPINLSEKYTTLGRGDSSMCYAVDEDTVLVVTELTSSNQLMVENSVEISGKLGRLYYSELDKENNKRYTFEKRAKGMELTNRIIGQTQPHSIETLADNLLIAQNLVEHLKTQFHANGVMHGDIHPSNIMIAPDGTVELIDYDWSVANANDALKTHQSPNGEHHDPQWKETQQASTKSDLYSLGFLFKEGVAGFLGLKLHELDPKIQSESGLDKVLEGLMDQDPNQRPALEEVASCLQQVSQQLKASVTAKQTP